MKVFKRHSCSKKGNSIQIAELPKQWHSSSKKHFLFGWNKLDQRPKKGGFYSSVNGRRIREERHRIMRRGRREKEESTKKGKIEKGWSGKKNENAKEGSTRTNEKKSVRKGGRGKWKYMQP